MIPGGTVIRAYLGNILNKLHPGRANLLEFYQTLCFHTKYLKFTNSNFKSSEHKTLILQ